MDIDTNTVIVTVALFVVAKAPQPSYEGWVFNTAQQCGFVFSRQDVEDVCTSLLNSGAVVDHGKWLKTSRQFEAQYHAVRA